MFKFVYYLFAFCVYKKIISKSNKEIIDVGQNFNEGELRYSLFNQPYLWFECSQVKTITTTFLHGVTLSDTDMRS